MKNRHIIVADCRGFTLIEMLVVIAIIGILSSIFLVGFQGYRNSANDAATISAVHKAQLALEQCYNENGNYNPNNCTAYQNIIGTIQNFCQTMTSDQTYVIGAKLLGKNSAANNGAASSTCTSVSTGEGFTCGNNNTAAVFCLSSSGR